MVTGFDIGLLSLVIILCAMGIAFMVTAAIEEQTKVIKKLLPRDKQ